MWIGFMFAALYGILGMVLAIAGYFIFDLIEWRIDFGSEVRKGNISAGIVIAAFILGLCFIIGRAIGS